MKPRSAAAERNREPILSVLCRHFADRRQVLEIGSGTGQHAAHFAQALPHLRWQPTDLPEHLDGIRQWRDAADLPNLSAPLPLDVDVAEDWAAFSGFDAVFSANTLHIMSRETIEAMFRHLPRVMTDDAVLAIYGPFRIGGRHTSASNEAFDRALRAAVPHRGVRDLEAVDALAGRAAFRLVEDCPLPANNRCVVWRRGGPG